MKIAALALASALAAIAGSAQPGFAQSTNQNSDQSQYGQDQNRTQYDQTGSQHMNESQPNMNGSMNDEEEGDENSYTTGQNTGNPQGNQNGPNWRNQNPDSNRGDLERGRMEGRMGRWHRHMMMGRSDGASFSFRNGPARMTVHCPSGEALQPCVNAATQLLEKIGSMKNLRDNSQTNGRGMSGSTGMSPSEDQSDSSANSTTMPGTQSIPHSQPNLPGDSNGADQSDRTDQQ
jgi:hypothetical protein